MKPFRNLSKKEHMRADIYGLWPLGFREYTYKSNNGHCTYCGIKMYFSVKDHPDYEKNRKAGLPVPERQCFIIEHLINDGVDKHTMNNLVATCRRCNSKKHSKELIEVTNFTLVY